MLELERICTDVMELSPCGPNVAVDILVGQWHSIHAVESGSVVLAVKNGRWESLSKEDILSL